MRDAGPPSEEQGRAVPRKVTQGFIAGSTCYFVAMELLGESLEEAPAAEHAALGEAALAALDRSSIRVHPLCDL